MRSPFPTLVFLLAPASAAAQSQKPATPQEAGHDFLRQVNSCDSACIDQVVQAVNPHPNAHQKQSLPNVVEKSKHDQSWQALLVEVIAVQSQSCESNSRKVQEANTNKDEKEKARRLADISVRANAHIKTIADPYVAEFMRLQINRVWSAPCPISIAHLPSRRDPEDADAQNDESATNDPPDDNH